ncbi:MAG: hypothetical protein SF097_23075 [Acidobacteriota bacterium]|nr:hypothetical protein [Acidobacteriota bacterium]
MKRFFTGSGRSVPDWACGWLILATLLCCAHAHSTATEVKGAGIWRSDNISTRLSKSNEELLLENLKEITGLCELQFKENGQLHLGPVFESNRGSAAARKILQRAIDSGFVFLVEDHSESSSVNFGQMDEGTTYEDALANRRFLIWRVRLDFKDFQKMQAPREVRESFSIGFTFLHELLHGLGHRDANQIQEIGECEELVNQARTELNLPTRDQYFAEQLKITGNYFTVRLRFRNQAHRRNQYLFFIAPPGSSLAELAEGVVVIKPKSN